MAVPAPAPLATPVFVVTGFLGSGKSTLLNRALAAPALARTAVVVNEFGDVGIDHLLVESSRDHLVELAGGCLCCTVRGDLARTLVDLLSRREHGACSPFERVIMETTGLADPVPVLNLLVTDPLLAQATRTAGVVTTLDAVNGPQTLDRYPEAVKQVALADAIVITKSDLVAAGEAAALAARARRINPRAATGGARDRHPDAVAELFRDRPSRPLPGVAHDVLHAHAEGIESFCLRRAQPVPGAALALFLETLVAHAGADLLRVKGLVELEEAPGRPALVQGAQHVLHPLDLLQRWPEPGLDRVRLVFIVRGALREWVELLFDAAVAEAREADAGLRRAPREPRKEEDSVA